MQKIAGFELVAAQSVSKTSLGHLSRRSTAATIERSVPRLLNLPLHRIFQIANIKRECYVNDLWELIGYETVSSDETKRDELHRAIRWLLKRLGSLDVVAFGEQIGMQQMPGSFKTIPMPPVVLGVFTQSPGKPTILIYGNLDVQSVSADKRWVTDPFVMTEYGDYMYGRGIREDKGPLVCWLNALQCYRDAGVRLPVNLVFLVESMKHSDSLGLEAALRQRISFFREVSCVAIASRHWQNSTRPSIVYGSRGVISYKLIVECTNRDLSSCEHGGTLFEALPDLFYLLSTLVDSELNLLVDSATSVYEVDRRHLRKADFDYNEFGESISAKTLPHEGDAVRALHNNWAMSHLVIHGIEGADSKRRMRNVIPHKVIGKFSIYLAPGQDPAEMTSLVQQHLGKAWIERGSPNNMSLCEQLVVPAWSGEINTPEYRAAARAMETTYGQKPNLIRDGGAILAPSLVGGILQKNVIMLPIADFDNGGGPYHERIPRDNYIKGTQMLAAFMWEYGNPPQNDGEFDVRMTSGHADRAGHGGFCSMPSTLNTHVNQ